MYVESLRLENLRSFADENIHFGESRWITLLGPNGCGKSTALQAIGLLLAGPEGAQKLLPRPVGWLRDEGTPGKLGIRISQSENDPGQFGDEKIRKHFSYSFSMIGSSELKLGSKTYTEPAIVENSGRSMTWLRTNALTSTGKGWFGVGYGAFRRLTRNSQIIVPALEPQARYTNFQTQFVEDEALSAFERWMVYLDYRIEKGKGRDKDASRLRDLGIDAINQLLPGSTCFDSVTIEGRVLFDVEGVKVPTLSLSDGYRSLLALGGDLVWRLIQAFPQTTDPLKEEGVVLIDELDIHLHPIWQRDIAQRLRAQFPNLQFIVATHSPWIAAGAGEDALTLKFAFSDGTTRVEKVPNISALPVDAVLQSAAFELVSPYTPQTQQKIDRYDELVAKPLLSPVEKRECAQLSLFMKEARPFDGPKQPGSLEDRVEKFLAKKLA
jgi:energy-coupling factor transporter ATP-binding protein EcfA2